MNDEEEKEKGKVDFGDLEDVEPVEIPTASSGSGSGGTRGDNTFSLLEKLEGEIGLTGKHFSDNINEIIGELKRRGYEYSGIIVKDTGPGRSSKCEYCGTAIRYEYYIVFDPVDDVGDRFTIMVGSTCVHEFEDVVGVFDDRKAMKMYKEYRDLYMEIEELEEGEETDVPEILYDELRTKIKKLREERKLKKLREGERGDLFCFVEERKEQNRFYKNVYNAMKHGYVSENQIKAIKKDMEKGKPIDELDREKEDVIDMLIFKSMLELYGNGALDLNFNDRDDAEFMQSLYNHYSMNGYISEKQAYWVSKLIERHSGKFGELTEHKNEEGFRCDACGSETGIMFSDRGFSICRNGDVVKYPDEINMNDVELDTIHVFEGD